MRHAGSALFLLALAAGVTQARDTVYVGEAVCRQCHPEDGRHE